MQRTLRPLEERFWEKVDKNGPVPDYAPELGPCWLWTGPCDGMGYGYISRGRRGEGNVKAHRLAYELLVGPIADGLEPDHLCRVHACVNPRHVEPVTHAENMRRSLSYWSTKTHCPRGHAYDDENTIVVTTPRPGRRCRKCTRAQNRERQQRSRANRRATKALKALAGADDQEQETE